MAPEVVSGEFTDAAPPIDMWSLGIVLYEILTKRIPFNGKSEAEVKKAILTYEPQFAKGSRISKPCRALIRSLLNKNRKERMTAFQAQQHPWLRDKFKDEEKEKQK